MPIETVYLIVGVITMLVLFYAWRAVLFLLALVAQCFWLVYIFMTVGPVWGLVICFIAFPIVILPASIGFKILEA